MEPLFERLGTVASATLVIAGALDDRGRPPAEAVAGASPVRGSPSSTGRPPPISSSPPASASLVLDFCRGCPPHDRPHRPRDLDPVVEYRDIPYEHSDTGIAKVTINRPEVRKRVSGPRPCAS